VRATGLEPVRPIWGTPAKERPKVNGQQLPRLQRLPISPRPLCVVFEEREGRVLGPPVSSSSARTAYNAINQKRRNLPLPLSAIHRLRHFFLRISP
jgi:hypothetical protein